jgi:hypothetical protein
MDIQQIRQQYPQYNNLSDGDLAYRLWDKNYRASMPMGQFADSIKLPQSGFSEMVTVARASGYEPTGEVGDKAPVGGTGAPRAALQGATFGFGDEIVGGMAGAVSAAQNVMAGKPANLSGEVSRFTGQERERVSQFRQESPLTAMGAEVAGAVAPAIVSGPVAALSKLPSVAQAAITGGATGALYGFGSGEGGVSERAENAVKVAIPSALFGAAAQTAINVAGRQAPRLAEMFRRSSERPSIETLRNTKNAAYEAVEQSGIVFDQNQMNSLLSNAMRSIDDANYVPDVDRQTFAAIRMIENNAGKERTIGQLDKLRQGLWSRYNASNGSEPAILDIIDSVDDMIASHPSTNDLMTLAREANSRFKKAELLDDAMRRAQLQTASTGSGGNVLNKYKQAVTSILTNPKKSKWFNEIEIGQMEEFIQGSMSENALRRIGKLSPSGNGLMLALNIGAIAANPAMAGATVVGAGAKALSDRAGERAMQGLMNTVSGVPLRPNTRIPYVPGAPQAVASVTSQNGGQ